MKATDSNPIKPPRTKNAASPNGWFKRKSGVSSSGRKKDGSVPSSRRLICVAITVAVTVTNRVRALIDTSSSSTANTMPPSGALNVAAIPAPAPAAISVTRSLVLMAISEPRVEPKAEPICTIGPSRPTEPPLPIETAEASDLITATRGRIRPWS